MVYLDSAAATPIDSEVAAFMREADKEYFANSSAIHRDGASAASAILKSRKQLAEMLDVHADEIVFTSGGTEADNLAVFGVARFARDSGIVPHIIVSAIEHSAVYEAAMALKNEGVDVSVVPVDEHGVVMVSELAALVRSETVLISIMYANNETGVIQPIREIARIIRSWKKENKSVLYPLFHTDAIQAFSFLPMRIPPLGVDMCTLSPAKTYGPKGIGMLYVRRGVELSPVQVGGGHEAGRRSGTLATPLILGGVAALAKADAMREKESERLTALRDFLAEEIIKNIPDAVITAAHAARAPHILHIQIPRADSDALVLYLDASGIRVSAQSACDSKTGERSRVLSVMNIPETHGAIRFSLTRTTTKEDIKYTVASLKKILPLIKKH